MDDLNKSGDSDSVGNSVSLDDPKVLAEWAVQSIGLCLHARGLIVSGEECFRLFESEVVSKLHRSPAGFLPICGVGVISGLFGFCFGVINGGIECQVLGGSSVGVLLDFGTVYDWGLSCVAYRLMMDGEGFNHELVERIAQERIFGPAQGNRNRPPGVDDINYLIGKCVGFGVEEF